MGRKTEDLKARNDRYREVPEEAEFLVCEDRLVSFHFSLHYFFFISLYHDQGLAATQKVLAKKKKKKKLLCNEKTFGKSYKNTFLKLLSFLRNEVQCMECFMFRD